MKIYLNGRILDSRTAKVSCEDRGLLLGDGLFETIKVNQGKPQLLELHWQRLINSSKILALSMPSYETVASGIEQLLDANQWQGQNGGIRLTLTRGFGPRSLLPLGTEIPQIIMQLFTLPPTITGLKLQLASIRRNETSPLSRIKSLNYLDNILAQQAAVQQGADAAVFLNTQGLLTTATFANIFLIKHQQILTPPLSDGVLPGIMRHCIIETCLRHNIPLKQQSITMEMITEQDSMWLTNAIRGVIPVAQIGQLKLHDNLELRLRVEKLLPI